MIITEQTKIKDIIDNYPNSVYFFKNLGLNNLEEPKSPMRLLSLKSISEIKKINLDTLIKQLNEYLRIETNKTDITLIENNKIGDIKVYGVLPCPVRVPLLEKLNESINEFEEKNNITVEVNLESASKGLGWLKDSINFTDEKTIPDIIISAGFEFLFSENAQKRIKDGFFKDCFPDEINEDFKYINIKDRYSALSVFSVVPAIFMINEEELEGEKIPESWEELLFGNYTNKVSIPVGDFDLFNSILLHMYKDFGMDGISKLKDIMFKSLHPTVAVKTQQMKNSNKPAVTVMPYFFSKMVRSLNSVKIIWPKDGAIISPIFALIRKDSAEKIKPIIDAIFSKEVGEILSHNGLFPSLHKDVKNSLLEPAKFKWIGWDYILENDTESLINKLDKEFSDFVGVA
ncbi:ABC transporter, substrate-binding protein [Deferribacter desulfuricans SSM1]|uniref:ABC transporter, substrate-binding protein n=1 Tax=Deferribacter desulfuricans (strain DSM 14783 / JCM 11476 / NBRC 101012 / SSM1) TaxID=639282 RepID=D3P8U3_DEFDS|nr:ABC transporter substrate-binding protein [Deferribacter desulfuricans]BAI81133.1 ABC transporter, substrate-binding protein [Deferribacter desulfuricans SSM1]